MNKSQKVAQELREYYAEKYCQARYSDKAVAWCQLAPGHEGQHYFGFWERDSTMPSGLRKSSISW